MPCNIYQPWRVCHVTSTSLGGEVRQKDSLKVGTDLIIVIIKIWFDDTVTVSHLKKCNTNSKSASHVSLTNYPHPIISFTQLEVVLTSYTESS